jgi:hypothetical protein
MTQPPLPPRPPRPQPAPRQPTLDQTISAAKFAGSVVAFIGALCWALVVKVTEQGSGWFAWGIGTLVGLVMSKMTTARGSSLGFHAALLAMLGLASGKVMTLTLATPEIADEIVNNPEMLTRAFILDMREREQYSAEVNLELAKFDPRRDTLPDELWETMVEEASERMEAAPPAERERVARSVWRQITMELSFMQKFWASFGIFDILWLLLAIGTAWLFMTHEQA